MPCLYRAIVGQLIFLAACTASTVAQNAVRSYRLVDLAANSGIPVAMNESDAIVGGLSRYTFQTGWQQVLSFPFTNRVRAALSDINDNGDFAANFGSFFLGDGPCGFGGSLSANLNNATSTPLASITSISNSGNLSGICNRQCAGAPNNPHVIVSACAVVNGSLIEAISGAPDNSVIAQSINDNGVAVINQFVSETTEVSRFVPGVGLTLLKSGPRAKTSGVAVNANGTIVGNAQEGAGFEHPFLSRPGESVTDVAPFDGDTNVTGINNAEEFIGSATRSGGQPVAYLHTPTAGYTDLSSYLPADIGFHFIAPTAMNNAGDIIGYFETNVGEEFHAFLLTSNHNPAITPSFRSDQVSVPAIYRPREGSWYLRTGSTPLVVHWGLAGDVPLQGDFDRDGLEDLVIYRPSTGYWWTCLSGSGYDCNQRSGVPYGLPGDLPVVGDFDGDGKSDRAVFRAFYAVGSGAATIRIEGQWYIQRSSGGEQTIQWGLRNDLPVPEDYDGDGKADIAVYRPSNGTWYILYSSKAYSKDPLDVGQFQFGLPEDHPMPADYDGDGRADLTVWRPSTGEWFRASSTFNYVFRSPYYPNSFRGYAQKQFGLSGDTPVRGDFDGDQTYDLAVWRENFAGILGTWYANSPLRTGAVAVQWGLPGDLPVGMGVKRLRQLIPRNADR